MNNKYAILFETTSIVSPSEITVLEEQDLGQGKSKAIFRSRFQTLNEQNSNRRIYDTLIGNMIYEQLSPKARNRSLLAEVDHPMFGTTDPNLLKKRATITEIQNAGALIRDLQVRNNEICGIMETLSGFKGPDLAALVTKDKVPIGFSLRALGSLEETNGMLHVKPPFKAITYDIVSNPSHATAKIMEFLPECSTEFIPENNNNNSNNMLFESEDEFGVLNLDDVTLYEDSSHIVSYMNTIYETEFSKIITKKIIFRI